MRTKKSRLRRNLLSLQELMRRIRHYTISDQAARSTLPCAATMPITRRRESPVADQGLPGRGTLLASDAAQPQPGWRSPQLGRLQPDQRTDTVAETKAAPPLPGAAGSCSAVNQLPKSVVREIRTPRSVGTG